MNLENFRIYQLSMDLGDSIWESFTTMKWETKQTVGLQIVRSADSIAANISEGYGRFHFKDSKKFYYYARGSAFETKTWITKLRKRDLISTEDYNKWMLLMNELLPKLNAFIKSVGK